MAVQRAGTCADVDAVVGGYLRDLALAQSPITELRGGVIHTTAQHAETALARFARDSGRTNVPHLRPRDALFT